MLIAITVAFAIGLAAWMGGLVFTFMREDTAVKIDVEIYSVNYNIGVLNEKARFDIFIENRVNVTRTIEAIVKADERVLCARTCLLDKL